MECKSCRFSTYVEDEEDGRPLNCSQGVNLDQKSETCERYEARERTRTYDVVEASKLHPSRTLPQREVDEKLVEAIKREGIQYPIIVRKSPYEKGTYEIIDGHIRHRAAKENQLVPVDIRTGIDDLEVFRISEATFTRIGRTTFDRARHYSRWTETIESKYGTDGAQARVAREAHLSEASVSYYISIGSLFERLISDSVSVEVFNALKTQSVNKLYALAKSEKEEVLLAVADKLAKMPEMTLKQLNSAIEEETRATDPLQQLIDDDRRTKEEIEAAKVDALKLVAQQLEEAMETTRKTISLLKTNVDSSPRSFLTSITLERIGKMMSALKRIEKEANKIAGMSPT